MGAGRVANGTTPARSLRRWAAMVPLIVGAAVWSTAANGQAPASGVPEPLEKVVTNLATLSKTLKLQGQFEYRTTADIMSYAYSGALRKLKTGFGAWEGAVPEETVLMVYLVCPTIEYKNLPTERPGYREAMMRVRSHLFVGSFDRMVSSFALREPFWELRYDQFPTKLRDVLADQSKFVDFGLLGQVEALRQRFR